MAYQRTTVAGASAQSEFTITWPWLDTAHIKMTTDGSDVDLSGATFAYDKTTGDTTITAAAQTGDVVIQRVTAIPDDLDSFIKSPKDTQHGTGLVMGDQPTNRALLYMLQEAEEVRGDLLTRVVALEAV